MRIFRNLLVGSLITIVCIATTQAAGPSVKAKKRLAKPASGTVTRTLSNISNWSYWMYYDGQSGIDPNGNSGGIYPRGTAGAIFQDGFIWGAKVPNNSGGYDIRVGGQTYNTGTVPGWIQSDGTPVSQSDPRNRIYRVRADWRTLTHAQVLQEAAEANMISAAQVTEAMTQEIIDQYAADWRDWPADLGAPFVDKDGDGQYNPDVDEAGIANADQTIWFVCNDMDRTATMSLYGSEPIGIELQVTAWAYNQPGARLGQIVFKKYKIINKSGKDLPEMYVAQWCDPDLGEASDDFLGCDTTLSMGFVYNGQDHDNKYDAFGYAPAAVGYDFFQGPLVNGVAGQDINKNGIDDAVDYGVFDLKQVGPGKVNLPMTGFSWFAAGSAISDPTLQNYDGTLQWWNMLRGYVPTTNITNPTPWTIGNIAGGTPTMFPMAGDPVTQTGDLDGKNSFFAPGDRRMALCSGPFAFANGDTQEVVVALIGGLGDTRFSSITEMKTTDAIAQTLYNGAFAGVPKAPAGPKVTVRPNEESIILEWGSDLAAVAATENPIIADYEFQGYNVYQLPSPSASKDEAVRIATYDKVDGIKTIEGKRFIAQFGQVVTVPVQYGVDAGVQRFIKIEKDYITGSPLREGSTYYFAVTAYNYNPNPQLIEDKALESALIALPVTVQEPLPGTQLTAEYGTEYAVTHAAGSSDGLVAVKTIDPLALTGHTYEIFFEVDNDTNSATYGETLWGVKDVTANVVKVSKQPQLPELGASNDQPIFDGVQAQVAGPPVGINTTIPGPYGPDYPDCAGVTWSGTRWVSWPTNWGLETMFGSLGNGFSFFGSDLGPTDYVTIEIRFAGLPEGVNPAGQKTEDLMALSMQAYPDRWQKAVVYWRPGYVLQTTLGWVPFTVWDIESDPPRQLKVAFVEDTRASYGGAANLIWDMGWGDDATFGANGGREYLFFLNDTYDTNYTDYLNGTLDGTYNNVMYASGWGARGTYPYLAGAFKLTIYASHVNTVNDKFQFTTTAPVVGDLDLAKEIVKKINVFPNPYYAYNKQSTNMYDTYVTFTHLPARATIRIFNLAGVMVRKIEKNDPSSQFQQWDLKNEANLPVASGIYIAHIDLPDLKKEKVLKFVIIQDRQILEYY